MRLVVQSGADQRRENLPTSVEIAGILPDEWDQASERDIILAVRDPTGNGPRLHRVAVTHAAYMPLHYVLLFPFGEYGWHYNLEIGDFTGVRTDRRFHQRPWYRFHLHTRHLEPSALFWSGRLFQQYVINTFTAYKTTTLTWLRRNQKKIRADVYNGLADTLVREDVLADEVGRRYILPSSFMGGDRFIQ
jgi:hypothetical protein